MHFVLVHGPWHGAWQWEQVADSLALLGYSSEAPTLLGHAPGDRRATLSFEDYLEGLAAILEGQDDKVVVVAHSALAGPVRAILDEAAASLHSALFLNPLTAPAGRCLLECLPLGTGPVLERLARESGEGSIPPNFDWIEGTWMPRSLPSHRDLLRSRAVPQALCLLDTPLPRAVSRPSPVPTVALSGVLDRSMTRGCREAILRALDPGLRMPVDGGHDSPLTHACAVAEALIQAARAAGGGVLK